jgi:hypothetical protein
MIPSTAHFIWIGREFPWLSWAAVTSAARNGGFERVVLHHTHDLSGAPWWRALGDVPGVESRRLRAVPLLEEVRGARLVDRYRRLEKPAARSNVLRVALLARAGGVYLDMDTITVASLQDLRSEAGFFCGKERVAFPASVRESLNPLAWGGALARTALRDVLRRGSNGVALFRNVEHFYPAAANNAVLGASPNHPFLSALLERMLELPDRAFVRRFALGTLLLQRALEECPPSDGVVHPPEVFYPLGPELSEHWFRSKSAATLDEVLLSSTRVVHWYASVRTRRLVPEIDSEWVERAGESRLLAALVRSALRGRLAPGRSNRTES